MKQQPWIGFLLASTATAMWGALPIALQQVLQGMDAQTIVWFRFFVAGVGLLLILSAMGALPKLVGLHRRFWWLLLVAVIGLAMNFWLYNVALQYIPPTTSQVLSPLSSFIMLFVGVLLFKEKIGLHQKISVVILFIGLVFFFNNRVTDFVQFSHYGQGVIIAILASIIWIAYGISQKMLLIKLSSQQILLLIYIGCSVAFFPLAQVGQVMELTAFQLGCLIFCCANTLIAYGCYAEALNRWEVSKVSAMMTQIPIFTIIFSEILTALWPRYFIDPSLNALSYVGAVLVVCGALLSVIGHKIFPQWRK
ncbi:DMT family transporter [Conservatibacter flavescens]|uniref:EamA family transporter n=1 Tax=Conservatibacter flavescens TaxID=28161 RepID=A0A2M8S2S0_9PAST|nr:DMT family transporter [Conservatibacter flavescens]PJG85450.1 EamA family transporter [Conservatibacter flavescens]